MYGFFHSVECFFKFMDTLACINSLRFKKSLNNISSYGYTTIGLSILLLRDILVVANF